MTAKLLSFTQQRGGWGNVEMAQFARIQRLLENVGMHIDVEHGITDEGDPWCVFCSNTTGEVIIHAARLDGLYMFDSPVLRTPIEGRSFQHCAEKFLDEAMQAIPVVRRRSTLQVHPSALLASVFLTIILHAQATSEHSPFRSDGHDVLAELDASGKHGAGWIKLIAQHLAELFGPQDNSNNGHHNQQMPTWVTVIPAGLTVSVLGIVHELVTGDDKLLLVFDETIGVESGHENADHDVPQVLAAAEAAVPEAVAAADDDTATTTIATDDAGDDKLEAKVAEAAAAKDDMAPVVLEVPGAYLALAHSFVEEVVAFAADTVSALATAGMTIVAQAEAARENASVEVAQAEPQPPTISTIATATIAQLKPLMDSDTMEFISLPDDAGSALILAAYGENRDPAAVEVITDDTGTSAGGGTIEVPAPTASDDASAPPPAVDIVAQLDWLIDIAHNVGYKQSGGNYIIYDKDVASHQNPDDWLVETFVMADHSQITFIGVASDYDGLLV
jgi:hypothetical protein